MFSNVIDLDVRTTLNVLDFFICNGTCGSGDISVLSDIDYQMRWSLIHNLGDCGSVWACAQDYRDFDKMNVEIIKPSYIWSINRQHLFPIQKRKEVKMFVLTIKDRIPVDLTDLVCEFIC
jgi:hypothetical protein